MVGSCLFSLDEKDLPKSCSDEVSWAGVDIDDEVGANGAGPEGWDASEDGPLPESAPDLVVVGLKSVKKSFLS